MSETNSSVPMQREEKVSFFDAIRRMLKRTTVITDKNGNSKYIAYPVKRSFSAKQKEAITRIEINDIDILNVDEERTLFQLDGLETIALGRDVLGVAYDAIPKHVKRLELGPDVRQIPEGAIKDSKIKTITGDGIYISTTSKSTKSDVYFDQDGRLHFEENANFSLHQVDNNVRGGREAVAATEAAARVLARQLLDATGTTDTKENVYIYAEDLGRESKYSIHAIVDEFPITQDKIEAIPDEKLIGLFVNSTPELDLATLTKYPNLKNIVVGKSVTKVSKSGSTDKTKVVDERGIAVWNQRTENGVEQSIKFLSPNVQLQDARIPVQPREDIVKPKAREERSLDD